MLDIERLHLQLPAGFAARAPRIARLTAHALAAQCPPLANGVVARVDVAPVRITRSRSDRAIARQIANQIAASIFTRRDITLAPADVPVTSVPPAQRPTPPC